MVALGSPLLMLTSSTASSPVIPIFMTEGPGSKKRKDLSGSMAMATLWSLQVNMQTTGVLLYAYRKRKGNLNLKKTDRSLDKFKFMGSISIIILRGGGCLFVCLLDLLSIGDTE